MSVSGVISAARASHAVVAPEKNCKANFIFEGAKIQRFAENHRFLTCFPLTGGASGGQSLRLRLQITPCPLSLGATTVYTANGEITSIHCHIMIMNRRMGFIRVSLLMLSQNHVFIKLKINTA